MTPKKLHLIFVYNADAGLFNLLTDMAHKMLSPNTYACNLCALTHGHLGMKKEWREFLATLDATLEFLHADEFTRKYQVAKIALPAIFTRENDQLRLLVAAATSNQCRTLRDLQECLTFGQSQNPESLGTPHDL